MGSSVAIADSAASVAGVVAQDLAPLVRRIDEDGLYPKDVMRRLGEAGAFARHARASAEGRGLVAAIEAMSEIGATCLSTAFCTWCQDALVWYLDRADNAPPRQRHLDTVASGRQLGGTALSNPMKSYAGVEALALSGRRVPGGYRVSGRLPWVSNLDDGHLFAGIFALEEHADRQVMAVLRAGGEGVTLARNAHFIALEGTGTYTVLLRQAFVADDDVITEDARRFVPRIRNGFVLLQAGMGLGAARGAAQLMRSDGRGRRQAALLPCGPDRIDERADLLARRVASHAAQAEDPDRGAFLEVLRTRLDISWLALEAAQSAMLQLGARGYVAGSEASRRLREAQFVAIVTPSVKHILTELAAG